MIKYFKVEGRRQQLLQRFVFYKSDEDLYFFPGKFLCKLSWQASCPSQKMSLPFDSLTFSGCKTSSPLDNFHLSFPYYARWNLHKSFELQVDAPLSFWVPNIFQAWKQNLIKKYWPSDLFSQVGTMILTGSSFWLKCWLKLKQMIRYSRKY